MAKKTIKDIDLKDWSRRPLQLESLTVERTADRILAALEKEREGEMVIGKVVARNWPHNNDPIVSIITGGIDKSGDIIFRPTKGDK